MAKTEAFIKAEAFVVWADLGQAITQAEAQLNHLNQLRLKARRVYEDAHALNEARAGLERIVNAEVFIAEDDTSNARELVAIARDTLNAMSEAPE